MTTITNYLPRPMVITPVVQLFKVLIEKSNHRANCRRSYKELSNLSTRELNDIGLTRGDIWSVAYGNKTSDYKTNSNLIGSV